MKSIVLGQYYPADSLLHRLDPRVKLVSTFVYIISLFIVKDLPGYICVTVYLLAAVILSKVPPVKMLRGLSGIIFLMLITVIVNLFTIPGTPLLSFHGLHITVEGVYSAVRMMLRLVYLITGSSVMTFTTTPSALSDGLESLMKPLKIFRVPVHDIAMMISIALRFIPILSEETDIIIKAQKARCADFDSGNMVKRAKAFIPVLVPLFVSAFRRAHDLATAMEARCYRGGDTRTRMKPLLYSGRDYLVYAADLALVTLCIMTRVML